MPKPDATSVKKGTPVQASDPNNWRPRILKAALKCFKRFGVKKTTVDDIAKEAGTSRPTVYRLFSGKTALLLSIANEEVERLVSNNLDVHEKITDIDELFIEAVYGMVRDCQKSHIVQFLLSPENEDASIALTDTDNEIWQTLLAGWEPLLARAKQEKRLRAVSSFEDQTRWITAVQTLMITRNRALNMSEESLRAWISDYIVPSLLIDKA